MQPDSLPLIPDLTRFIERLPPYYSVSGGAYGDIYRCLYHGPDGDVEVCADLTLAGPPYLLTYHASAGRCESTSTTIHQ